MSRSDGPNRGARRRTVLKLLSAAAGAAALPATGLGQTEEGEFAVIQGDRCMPVTPLAGDRPIEEFYDWNEGETDYSSAGTTDLQRDDTSILFLYDGPNGTSLVLVHGHYGSGESGGGSVSMTFTGLPEGGEWVVEDDLYDGDQNYDNWNHGGTRSEIDWTYRFGRTDGGAFLGLDGDVELRIEPAFNDASEFGDEHYTSELADWQVLSGDVGGPDRISLAMDQPVVIRSGGCGATDDLDDGGTSSEDGETDGDGSGGTEGESGDEETKQGDETEEKDTEDGTDTEETQEREDGKDEDRRRTKHERKREKHRKKHEKQQQKHRRKHRKQQQKHEKEERRKESKHEKRQRKHEKEEDDEREEEEKEERRERKHRRRRQKHRKRERKHEREESDDSRGGPDGLGDELTSVLDGVTGRDRDD